MKRKHLFPILALVLVVAGLLFLQRKPAKGLRMIGPSTEPLQPFQVDPDQPLSSLANLTFDLEGRRVTLKEGRVDVAFPGYDRPWMTGLTQYQVAGDLDADGFPDAAALIVSASRGIGAKHYLVACLRRKDPASKTGVSAVATNTIALGEDVSMDQLVYVAGGLDLRFLSHAPGDPPGSAPSWVREFRFTVKDGVLSGKELSRPPK